MDGTILAFQKPRVNREAQARCGLPFRVRPYFSYTTGSIAKWLTNYGQKINNLSLLNVEPEMIEFGTNVAMTLSQAGQVLTTGNI